MSILQISYAIGCRSDWIDIAMLSKDVRCEKKSFQKKRCFMWKREKKKNDKKRTWRGTKYESCANISWRGKFLRRKELTINTETLHLGKIVIFGQQLVTVYYTRGLIGVYNNTVDTSSFWKILNRAKSRQYYYHGCQTRTEFERIISTRRNELNIYFGGTRILR